MALECLHACNDDFRCQSFNYVFSQRMCELNNRTKEARPESFVPDSERYYFRRDKKRGKLLYAISTRNGWGTFNDQFWIYNLHQDSIYKVILFNTVQKT